MSDCCCCCCNHGLCTKKAVSGTEYCRDHQPPKEPAVSPMLQYRLQNGYAFTASATRDWREVPNDDWEHTVVSTPGGAHPPVCLGFRTIDGATCAVFLVENRWLAQLASFCFTVKEG